MLHYCKTRYIPEFSKRAKALLGDIEKEKFSGVVSTLSIAELHKIIREIDVKYEAVYASKDWNKDLEDIIGSLYKIKNIQIVDGNVEKDLKFADVIDKTVNLLKKYTGKVKKDEDGKFQHDGFHAADCIHIILAQTYSCDRLATFDMDFDESKSEIEPLLLTRGYPAL